MKVTAALIDAHCGRHFKLWRMELVQEITFPSIESWNRDQKVVGQFYEWATVDLFDLDAATFCKRSLESPATSDTLLFPK